jgi:hypothetical protein
MGKKNVSGDNSVIDYISTILCLLLFVQDDFLCFISYDRSEG